MRIVEAKPRGKRIVLGGAGIVAPQPAEMADLDMKIGIPGRALEGPQVLVHRPVEFADFLEGVPELHADFPVIGLQAQAAEIVFRRLPEVARIPGLIGLGKRSARHRTEDLPQPEKAGEFVLMASSGHFSLFCL